MLSPVLLSSPTRSGISGSRGSRGSQGSQESLNHKIQTYSDSIFLGILLMGEWWFYLGGSGWNGGGWCLAFRRVAALPLPSLLQPPDPLFKGALVAALLCLAFGFVCRW